MGYASFVVLCACVNYISCSTAWQEEGRDQNTSYPYRSYPIGMVHSNVFLSYGHFLSYRHPLVPHRPDKGGSNNYVSGYYIFQVKSSSSLNLAGQLPPCPFFIPMLVCHGILSVCQSVNISIHQAYTHQ